MIIRLIFVSLIVKAILFNQMAYQNKHFSLILLSFFHSILLKQLISSIRISQSLLLFNDVFLIPFQNTTSSSQMLIEFLILTAFILGTVVYFTILKPYLVYRRYSKLLPSLGYKTFIHPFRPLGSNIKQTMSRDDKVYGDPVKLFKQVYPHFDVGICNFYSEALIQIVNPDLVKEFYQNNNQNNYDKADVLTSSFKMLINNGIIMKQGNEWKLRKKIISSVFTHDFLIHLLPEIHKITNSRLDQMEKKYSATKDGKQVVEVDLHMIFQQIFSEVMARLFFGSDPSQTLEEKDICTFINQLMAGIMELVRSPLFQLFGQRVAGRALKHKLKSFKHLARNLIDKRVKQIEEDKNKPSQPRDIIEALVLSGQFSYKEHASETNNEALTYDDLIGEFCTFFIAGMDTTSNLMASIVYHLAKKTSQEVMQKLRTEVKSILQEQQLELLTFKDLKKMNYAQMVQKQGLRMFAPVTGIFFRRAIVAHKLKDIPIPVGTTVVVRNRSNMFKEEYFKDPFTFEPERWKETNPKLHPYAYLPFSSGARTCIGNHLSLIEGKIVLVALLKRYKRITLQKENYKMTSKFLYLPEKIKITLEKQI